MGLGFAEGEGDGEEADGDSEGSIPEAAVSPLEPHAASPKTAANPAAISGTNLARTSDTFLRASLAPTEMCTHLLG